MADSASGSADKSVQVKLVLLGEEDVQFISRLLATHVVQCFAAP